MSRSLWHVPPPKGAYPERIEADEKWLERAQNWSARNVHRLSTVAPWRARKLIKEAQGVEKVLGALDNQGLLGEARALKKRLHVDGFRDELVARSFALVREAAIRELGQRQYDVQLHGGWILLRGMVAEMETGEGKTLTATLPAATAALAGIPVHVITVNDYLAARDAEWMRPVYERLGLTVGTVVHGLDHRARREAYSRDVVYCCNKEIAFDYLRDRIALRDGPSRLRLQLEGLYGGTERVHGLILRGLRFAIVDEADSVLVDEARTPLIISTSENAEQERHAYESALKMATTLVESRHYKVLRNERRIELTPSGRGKLAELGRVHGNFWARRQLREEMAQQALSAQHLFFRDKHYLVRDEKVQIIDEFTGRTMPDRSWEHGLHQAIEAKEGCPLTAVNRPLARISYQRFFRRYWWLAGMTGTAMEVAGELGSVYGLPVVRIPTHRRMKRTAADTRIFMTHEAKQKAIVDRIVELHAKQRPILVGTRSVESSEELSRLLEARELPHQVLNARQDEAEAEIIARAGEKGAVTVATNMAGRGTDIRLAEGVADLGGLHVLATERHEARRIDRQLFGRCGRQGDPGTYEAFVSLDEELITQNVGRLRKILVSKKREASGDPPPQWLCNVVSRAAQRSAERINKIARRDLLHLDVYLDSALAFAGSAE